MRRLQGATIALVSVLLAGPAAAAEISRVASSGEPDRPFELDIGVRWDRWQERATITREGPGPGGVGDVLRYTRTRNAIVPRFAVGLWRDLELHAELPYILEDGQSYRYATRYGKTNGDVGLPSTIDQTDFDASGAPCSGPCPMFVVSTAGISTFHGGRAGDLRAGLAYAIFNERKDDTKPTWVVGVDVTFPTGPSYDPSRNRTADWTSPYTSSSKPGPIGERVWKWDAYTVMSRRLGAFDPYVKAHTTAMFASGSTFSNCKAAAELQALGQMNSQAVANCATAKDTGALLPWVAGAVLGTEIVPYEDKAEGQKVALDVRVRGDWTSKQRFFNELTDASGKIHMTDGYLELGGLAGLYLDASSFVQFQAVASIATRSAHWLTGESLGNGNGWPALAPGTGITADPSAMNPNFDWRYDGPGNRFRIGEVSVFELSFAGVIRF